MKKTIIIVFAFISFCATAQTVDSAAIMRQFLKVCTDYRRFPLQVELEYQKQANLAYDDDTSVIQAGFYMRDKNAYIRFGDMEQMIEDSLQLMVMPRLKQMVLTTIDSIRAEKIRQSFGFMLPDSAIAKISDRFSVMTNISEGRGIISLTGRKQIYSTALPFEQVILTYNIHSNEPENVQIIRRSLIALPDGYETASKEKRFKTIVLPDATNMAIREETTRITYKKIDHDKAFQLPVHLQDRVKLMANGEYEPVKDFEDYYLQQN